MRYQVEVQMFVEADDKEAAWSRVDSILFEVSPLDYELLNDSVSEVES